MNVLFFVVLMFGAPMAVLTKKFSIYEPFDRLPLNQRPVQYARQPRNHEISEYLSLGQRKAYAKRYGSRKRDDTFEDTDPFHRKSVKNSRSVINRLAASPSINSRRLEETIPRESSQPLVATYPFSETNAVLSGCVAAVLIAVVKMIYMRRKKSGMRRGEIMDDHVAVAMV